jgi:hypothetical protein
MLDAGNNNDENVGNLAHQYQTFSIAGRFNTPLFKFTCDHKFQ